MNRIETALITGLKVCAHILVAALLTGLVAVAKHDATLMAYLPAVNVITATIWKYLYPGETFPGDSSL